MTRTTFILSVAVVVCLLLSECVHSQEFAQAMPRLQIFEAEIEVRLGELELALSEHAVEDAKSEFEKSKINAEAAEQAGHTLELRIAKLGIKQSQNRVAMQAIHSQMARLRIERAKARLLHLEATLAGDRPSVDDEIPDRSEQIRKLSIQRRDVLSERVRSLKHQYEAGEATTHSVLLAQNDLLDAELDLADSKEKRIAILKEAAANHEAIEEVAEMIHEQGTGPLTDLLEAKAARIAAGIELLREQSRD